MKHGKESSPNAPGRKREMKQGGESDLSMDVIMDMNLKASKARQESEKIVLDMNERPTPKSPRVNPQKVP